MRTVLVLMSDGDPGIELEIRSLGSGERPVSEPDCHSGTGHRLEVLGPVLKVRQGVGGNANKSLLVPDVCVWPYLHVGFSVFAHSHHPYRRSEFLYVRT